MMAYSPLSTCTKKATFLISTVPRPRQTHNYVFDLMQSPSNSCSGFNKFQRISTCHSFVFKSRVNPRCYRKTNFNFSTGNQNLNLRILLPKQTDSSDFKFRTGPVSFRQSRGSAGFFIALSVCFASEKLSNTVASEGNEEKFFTDYSVIGIPGDGRCLFRSVSHGACLRSGKPPPNETLQKELADELRARVADEFVKRREETEWFIEGDFDTYISKMREPHVWGGEPELLMASHVLQMPITVYMYDRSCGGLISIAEYGQEYGKENPIKVLFHGFGHYDALQLQTDNNKGGGARSRL